MPIKRCHHTTEVETQKTRKEVVFPDAVSSILDLVMDMVQWLRLLRCFN
jgi:hypothetical protein